jgi:hypothetical protein
MTTPTAPYGQPAPFGQPEPFNPMSAPAQPVRRPPSATRRLLPIVGAVAIALVAFAGGYLVANATSSGGSGAQALGNGGQGFGPNASFRTRDGGGGGFGGFGGGAAGTISSVSSDQMTISTQNGGSRIVLLTPTTTVTQVTSATKAITDLSNGETVTVVGTANPDGSVTATRVIIGEVGGLFGGGRGFGPGGPDASPAPSNAAQGG